MPNELRLDADIEPVSDFREHAATTIEKVRSTGRPVLLTQRGRGAVVLLDVRRYQQMVDELELERDIRRGLSDVEDERTFTTQEVRATLLERIRGQDAR